MDNKLALIATTFSSIFIDFTPMKYSVDDSPFEKAEAVLTGLVMSGVNVSNLEASTLGTPPWFPRKT
ncbi:hypothetical protein Lal_00047843 [Lupinus albus]|nr:hypothetical protein Lal_00047843 [Lupinus albus]